MIFLRVKIDNLFSFKNTEVNLSYPKKLSFTTIDGEYLEERPNFKFKKVCILSGANSSGKTTFGKVLLSIQLFIKNQYVTTPYFSKYICDKKKEASFEVDAASVTDLKLHRFNVVMHGDGSLKSLVYINTKIGIDDSYFTTKNKLDFFIKNKKTTRGSRYITSLDKKLNFIAAIDKETQILKTEEGWYYLYTGAGKDSISLKGHEEYLSPKKLKAVLKTFDPSINDVKFYPDIGYSVSFINGDQVNIDNSGDFTQKDRLSTGTYYAIEVAILVSRIIREHDFLTGRPHTVTYFLDEKMAFAHSELERYILNLIIDKLPRYAQFFYTTHNHDILETNLPAHSFIFTKKKHDTTEFIDASTIQNKNDRSLVNYVKSNMFDTIPNTDLLDELLWSDKDVD